MSTIPTSHIGYWSVLPAIQAVDLQSNDILNVRNLYAEGYTAKTINTQQLSANNVTSINTTSTNVTTSNIICNAPTGVLNIQADEQVTLNTPLVFTNYLGVNDIGTDSVNGKDTLTLTAYSNVNVQANINAPSIRLTDTLQLTGTPNGLGIKYGAVDGLVYDTSLNQLPYLGVPIGTITMYAGQRPPSNDWLICDGSILPSNVFSELSNVIGTIYGTSSGNVVIPDLRSRFPIMNQGQINNTGGSPFAVLSVDNIPIHTHTVNDYYMNTSNRPTAYGAVPVDVGDMGIGSTSTTKTTYPIATDAQTGQVQNAGTFKKAMNITLVSRLNQNYISFKMTEWVDIYGNPLPSHGYQAGDVLFVDCNFIQYVPTSSTKSYINAPLGQYVPVLKYGTPNGGNSAFYVIDSTTLVLYFSLAIYYPSGGAQLAITGGTTQEPGTTIVGGGEWTHPPSVDTPQYIGYHVEAGTNRIVLDDPVTFALYRPYIYIDGGLSSYHNDSFYNKNGLTFQNYNTAVMPARALTNMPPYVTVNYLMKGLKYASPTSYQYLNYPFNPNDGLSANITDVATYIANINGNNILVGGQPITTSLSYDPNTDKPYFMYNNTKFYPNQLLFNIAP